MKQLLFFFIAAASAACAALPDVVHDRAAYDFACADVRVRNVAGASYEARGCGKLAVYDCVKSGSPYDVTCIPEQQREAPVEAPGTAMAPAAATAPAGATPPAAVAPPEPIDVEAACAAAAEYDKRAAAATNPAKGQLEKIAARKHQECASGAPKP